MGDDLRSIYFYNHSGQGASPGRYIRFAQLDQRAEDQASSIYSKRVIKA